MRFGFLTPSDRRQRHLRRDPPVLHRGPAREHAL